MNTSEKQTHSTSGNTFPSKFPGFELSHGQNYIEIKPVIHIAFLDYSLFPENPEFCASYQLMNQKKYVI